MTDFRTVGPLTALPAGANFAVLVQSGSDASTRTGSLIPQGALNLSGFVNDVGFITPAALDGYATTSSVTAMIPTRTLQLTNDAGFLTVTAANALYTSLQQVSTVAQTVVSAAVSAAIGALPTVARSGSYADLANKPVLGGAAALAVGTVTGTVAAGDDARIVGALSAAIAATTYATPAAVAAAVGALPAAARSGSYSDLTNKPALGTAAALNVGAVTGTVAAGDDARIVGALSAATAAGTYALASSVPGAGGSLPVVDGTAAAGTSSLYSRQDHVHPTDTSRLAAKEAGFFGGASSTQRLGYSGGVDYRTWVGQSDNGNLTYFDTSSSAAAYAGTGQTIGLAAAARTSSGNGAIGIGAYGNADSTTSTAPAWAAYTHAVCRAGSSATSVFSAEINIANVGSTVSISPYTMAPAGVTASAWLSVGGETAQSGITVNPASVAIGIVTNGAGQAGAVFQKGIAVQAGALAISNATLGTQIYTQLPKGAECQWTYDGSAARSGFIRSDATAPAMGMVIDNTGVTFRGSDETVLATVTPTGSIAAADINVAGTGSVAGAWTTYSGAVTAASGALGASPTLTMRYKKIGRIVTFMATASIPNNGTGATAIVASLPFQTGSAFTCVGRETAVNGKVFAAYATNGASTITLTNYDNSYPGVSGASLVYSGTYETAS